MTKNKVIFVVGPTASGKTALSVKLAKEFGGEIVSADSMQIYKGIHIASAAPSEAEKGGIPHHLLEFLDEDTQFSVADYVKLSRKVINEITERGKLPIVTGGTGLYISSLLDNTEFSEVDTDYCLRETLEKRFDESGGEKMLEELSSFDPESAKRLHPSDRRRIIRCFEIYELTGKTATEQNENSHKNACGFEPLVIGITYKNRDLLYNRIGKRVDLMIENGLIDEARKTFEKSNSKGGFQAIGHKELYGYFKGECSLEDAIEHLKQQTRRYAKRQLTWFRRDNRINWIFADECEDVFLSAKKAVEEFLKN